MHGGIELPQAVIISAVAVVAAATDLARGKIHNILTLPALAAGVAAAAVRGGWAGLGGSLGGAAIGIALYAWMFFPGFVGGGDVKLLAAFGAWGGVRYAVEVAALGVLLGGVLAIVLLAASGRLPGFARGLRRLITSGEFPKIDRKFRMPFGIPLGAAAIWAAWDSPLERLGFPLWS